MLDSELLNLPRVHATLKVQAPVAIERHAQLSIDASCGQHREICTCRVKLRLTPLRGEDRNSQQGYQ